MNVPESLTSEPLAWRNGCQLPLSQLNLPVWDLGVVAGASISEMARTYRHRLYHPERHVERLLNSCHEIGFPCSYSAAELLGAAQELVQSNGHALSADEDLGIVWFVTAGANRTYLGTNTALGGGTVGIHTFRLPFELWADAAAQGVRLRVPTIRQISRHSLPVHRKIRNRLHWWLADREAAEAEAGARALLLDEDGLVTETSTSAFFAVLDGAVVTADQHVLNSLSCRLVADACEALRIPFRQAEIRHDQLPTLESAFVSSTPSGIFSVAAIDGLCLPSSDIVDRILDWWRQTTGVNPRQQILSVVSRTAADGSSEVES